MGEQDLQLSCWAKIHLKLVSWCKFEDQDFPFLVSFSYRSSFHFWKFLIWLQILPWCWLPWHMRPIRTWISSFKPFPSIKSIESTTVDQLWLQLTFLGFWTDWTSSDDFQTLNPWELDFKWCLKMYEPLINDHGAQILQEWPPSTALTDCWLSLT